MQRKNPQRNQQTNTGNILYLTNQTLNLEYHKFQSTYWTPFWATPLNENLDRLSDACYELKTLISNIDYVIEHTSEAQLCSQDIMPNQPIRLTYEKYYGRLANIRYELSKNYSKIYDFYIKQKRKSYHLHNQKALNHGGIYLDGQGFDIQNMCRHHTITFKGISL